MSLSTRWKVVVVFTLLTAAALGLLDAYLRGVVLRNGADRAAGELLTQARLVARLLPPTPWRTGTALQSRVSDLDATVQARLTLIGPDGRVAADSRDDPAVMENHADRPERQQALRDGWGRAVRYSHTLRMDMLYVAYAVPGPSDSSSVVRLARPLTEVRAATQQLRHTMLVAFLLTAALVWLVSLATARMLAVPLQNLVRVARRVGRGDLQARVSNIPGGRLGELSRVLNETLDTLAALVAASQREGRHYAAILEQMSEAVIIIDDRRRVQFINPVFARLFGVDAHNAPGLPVDQVILNYELSSLLGRALETRSTQHEQVRVLQPEPRALAAAVTPLVDGAGQVVGAVGLLHDVTELQRLEDVRREFVANASHELRTPAATIKAVAEALQMGALQDPEAGPRFAAQIVEAADRLTAMLDDMLTLTRVESGPELLRLEPHEAAPLLNEAATQLHMAAETKGVALRVQVAPADRLVADAGALHTVLLNLLENAIKYTPAGGEVVLAGQPVAGGYEISVTDTGAGIPAKHQGRIFERFYRVDRARDRATGGTGLGLSIVKHIVEAHGGRVGVKSAPGEGSTFTVFLPGREPR